MSKYYDRQSGFAEGQKIKPKCVKTLHLTYLDGLRSSGDTNMMGARPFLMEEFPDLSEHDASAVLSFWMRTFSERM